MVLQYTYYTASALEYRVPQYLKRTLTILQITQFVWGSTYAVAHLFVQYDIPIQTPFQVMHTIERAVPSARSAVSSATSALTSAAELPLSTALFGDYVKKLLLRAAGEEGVAERLALRSPALNQAHPQSPLIPGMSPPSPQRLEQKVQKFIEHQYETRYHNDWSRINCIDTSGEAFAIYLNLLYLAPLTFLFGRFFIRAYTQRAEQEDRKRRARSASQVLHDAAQAVRKASNDTRDEVEGKGEKVEAVVDEKGGEVEDEVRDDIERVVKELRSGSGLQAPKEKVKQAVETVEKKVNEVKSKAQESAKKSSTTTQSQSQQSSTEATETSTSSTTRESTQQQEESSSSFASKAKAERQSSSTWIKGGAGLFRRDSSKKTGNDDNNNAVSSTDEPVKDAHQSANDDDSANKGEDTEESEEKQDENLEGSQDTRPGTEEDGQMAESREDSDAMGRSGRIVSAQDAEEDGQS